MAAVDAKPTDIVVAVTCRHGTSWVREHAVPSWACRCGRKSVGAQVPLHAAMLDGRHLVRARCERGHLSLTTVAGLVSPCWSHGRCGAVVKEISEMTYQRTVARSHRRPEVDAELEDLDLDELLSHLPTPALEGIA